jgi:type IV pilus assembly protein PilO
MALTADSILKLPRSKKIMLLIAVLLALTGVYYYFLYAPEKQNLDALEAKYNTLAKQLQESKAIHRDLEKFEAEVNKLNAELAVVRTQLPDEKEIPDLLRNISSLGKESNLEFILFRPKPEEPQQFYAKVPIDLTVNGHYHDLGVFFDKVSKLPRIINVVDFNITRAKDSKGKGEVKDDTAIRTSCLLNTYRFVEQKPEEKKVEKKKSPQQEQESEDAIPKKKK